MALKMKFFELLELEENESIWFFHLLRYMEKEKLNTTRLYVKYYLERSVMK